MLGGLMGQNLWDGGRTRASLRPICHTFQQVTRWTNRRRGLQNGVGDGGGRHYQKPTEEDVDDDDDDERGLAGGPS